MVTVSASNDIGCSTRNHPPGMIRSIPDSSRPISADTVVSWSPTFKVRYGVNVFPNDVSGSPENPNTVTAVSRCTVGMLCVLVQFSLMANMLAPVSKSARIVRGPLFVMIVICRSRG